MRWLGALLGAVIGSAHAAPAVTAGPAGEAIAGPIPAEDVVAVLSVTEPGVHRITYEQLLRGPDGIAETEDDIDLAGVRTGKLALRLNGENIARRITDSPEAERRGHFGPGSAIEFIAAPRESLYGGANRYTLHLLERGRASDIRSLRVRLPRRGAPAASYLETREANHQRAYSYSAPNGDPWYAAYAISTYDPAWGEYAQSGSDSLDISALAPDAGPAQVEVELWGGVDLLAEPDHSVTLSLNGTEVGTYVFDGLETFRAAFETDALRLGTNTLRLAVNRPDGQEIDLVHLDRWRVTFARPFIAREDRLTFTAAERLFRVDGLSEREGIRVYRQHPNGRVHLLEGIQGEGACSVDAPDCSITFAGLAREAATYYVSTERALLQPALELPPPPADITAGEARYRIIAHPDFADDESLQQLAALRDAEIVDVRHIYAQFGHHQFHPQAIRDYLAYAYTHLGLEVALLVGGDTYDYANHSNKPAGAAPISFIPSLYAATDPLVRYAPADPLFADVDPAEPGPELQIGRLPVRTSAELAVLVQKISDYEFRDSAEPPYGNTAVFVADKEDTGQGYNFTRDIDAMIAMTPADWRTTRISLDEQAVGGARASLLGALNAGTSLVSYVGHSGPSEWTFSGLFSASLAARLGNAGRPAVVTQWGCWNTYYVDPAEDTLAHRLLLAGDRGAVAVLGAVSLTQAEHERGLAGQLYGFEQDEASADINLFTPGVSLGEAVLQAKRAYAAEHPEHLDVLLGWTILGDPDIVVQP